MSIRLAKRYTIETAEDVSTKLLLLQKAIEEEFLSKAITKAVKADTKLKLALIDAALAYQEDMK